VKITYIDIATRFIFDELSGQILANPPSFGRDLSIVFPVTTGGMRIQGGWGGVSDSGIRYNTRRFSCKKEH